MSTTPKSSGDIIDVIQGLADDIYKLKQLSTTTESLGAVGTDPVVDTITVGGVVLSTTISPATSLVLTHGAFYTNIFVDVAWTAPVDGSAVEYLVQIAKKTGIVYDLLAEVRTGGTALRIDRLLPTQTYGVRVYAVNRLGIPGVPLPSSGWTDVTTAKDSTVPAQVTNLSVGQGLRSVTAVWDESADADVANSVGQYEVQIATNVGFTTGLRSEFTSATVVSFNDLVGTTTYYVRVRAIDSSLNIGAWSTVASTATTDATSSDGTPPSSSPTPTVSGGAGFLFAEWVAAGGTTDVITYEVHVSTSSGFTPDASTLTDQVSTTFVFLRTRGSGATALVYGTTYYVKLIAKDRDGAAAAGAQGSGAFVQIVTGDLAVDSVTASQLAALSVIEGKIAANAVTTAKIAADAVTAGQIAAGAVGTSEIANLAVTSAQVAASAITTAKIAADAVTAGEIAANAVGTTELAALAVTEAKVAAAAITTAKIAADAVTAGEIAAGAVGTTEIAALAVNDTKIAANAVTTAKIANLAVTAGQIAANAVDVTKLNITLGGGNLLVNTSFEADSNADGLPDNWVIGFGSVSDTQGFIRTTSDKYYGTYSLKLQAAAAANMYVRQDIDLPVGRYTASVWVRRASVTPGFSGLNIDGSFITFVRASPGTSLDPEHNGTIAWRREWITFDVTAFGQVRFFLQQGFGTNSTGTTYFDGLQLEAGDVLTSYAPRATELLPGTITSVELAPLSVTTAALAATAVTTAKIAADAVTAAEIAANAVTSSEIAALAVTTTAIAANAITTAKIAADAVTAAEIAALAVGSNELAAGAVIAGKITAGTIVAGDIAANTITAGQIAALTITASQIAADTITAGQIAANAITTTELNALAVTAAKIAANTITAGQIAANTITAGQITALTITAAEIAASTITGAKIAADTIVAGNIAANAITSSELAANAVVAGKITAGTIVAADIASGVITALQLAANTITAGQIAADTITAAQIAANAITASELAAGSVTAGKIAALSIVAGDIASGTITATQIATGTLTALQIAADTITSGQIAANAITASEIAAGAVTAGKIAALSIVAGDIAASTITGAKIAATTITAANIAADTLTAAEISASAITTSELAAGAVTAGKIAALTIVAGDIAASTITGAKIAATTITAANIAADTLTASQIAANAITASELAAGAVTAGKIAALTIVAGDIAVGTITAAQIASKTITTNKLTIATVTDNRVPNGGFEDVDGSGFPLSWTPRMGYNAGTNSYGTATGAGLYNSGSRAALLQCGTITSTVDLVSESIPVEAGETWSVTSSIRGDVASADGYYLRLLFATTADSTSQASFIDVAANAAVTTGWVDFSGAFTVPASMTWMRIQLIYFEPATASTLYVDNIEARRQTVGTEIKDGSIITAKIAAGAITAASAIIADATIATAKIQDLAVTTLKVADLNITNAKLANLAVDSAKIADLAVTDAKIANATISSAKIVTLAANKITAGTITSQDITLGTGGQLKTASLAPGLLINSNGIGLYNGAGTRTIFLNAATGLGDFQGAVTSSTVTGSTVTGGTIRTASSGRRIELNSGLSNNSIYFYTGSANETLPGELSIQAGNVTAHGDYGRVELRTANMGGGIAYLQMDSATADAFATSTIYMSATDITLAGGSGTDAIQLGGDVKCNKSLSIGNGSFSTTSKLYMSGTLMILGGITGAHLRPSQANSSDVALIVGDGVNYARFLSQNNVNWREVAALSFSAQSDPTLKNIRRNVRPQSSIEIMRSIGRPFLFNWKEQARRMSSSGESSKEWLGVDSTMLPPTLTTETVLPPEMDDSGEPIAGAIEKKSTAISLPAMDAFLLGICHDLADQVQDLTERLERIEA